MSEVQSFPRGALVAAGGMVGLTLALTAAVPLGLMDRPQTAQELRVAQHVAPVASRDLRFLDRADGALLIEDVRGDATVLAPGGNNGFIRGVLRGLARDRKRRGIGQQPPFRLTLWANGRLSLEDVATRRVIELDSFGSDNRTAFARLLPPTPATRIAAR